MTQVTDVHATTKGILNSSPFDQSNRQINATRYKINMIISLSKNLKYKINTFIYTVSCLVRRDSDVPGSNLFVRQLILTSRELDGHTTDVSYSCGQSHYVFSY